MIKLPCGVNIENLIDDLRIFSWEASDIFLNYSQILKDSKNKSNILKNDNTVVSLGGGAIINKSISNIIKMNSYNIYLEVNINILKKRLIKSKNRPLIIKKDINKTLKEL